jgi:hypothetical protein
LDGWPLAIHQVKSDGRIHAAGLLNWWVVLLGPRQPRRRADASFCSREAV